MYQSISITIQKLSNIKTNFIFTFEEIVPLKHNFSFSKSVAHVYGQGVYFAVEAEYSQRYATAKDGKNQMILADVLVGESIAGESSMRALPQRTPQRTYDSTFGPKMFVVFHDSQAYPAYVITS